MSGGHAGMRKGDRRNADHDLGSLLVAVYRGMLDEISEGKVISSQGTGFSARWGLGGRIIVRETGVDTQAGWTSREFVDVGGQRIRNVMLAPRHDQLLKEAVGQEVAMSMTGPSPSSPKATHDNRDPHGEGRSRPARFRENDGRVGRKRYPGVDHRTLCLRDPARGRMGCWVHHRRPLVGGHRGRDCRECMVTALTLRHLRKNVPSMECAVNR